jgi:hypothetical protein
MEARAVKPTAEDIVSMPESPTKLLLTVLIQLRDLAEKEHYARLAREKAGK